MKVEIYDAYSKKAESFQGPPEEIFKELVDKFGYLKYRCQNLDEAVEEISRGHKYIVSKEE